MMFSKSIPSLRLILIMAVFFTLTMNYSLFSHLLAAYPLNTKNALFLLTFAIGYTGLIALIFALLSFKYTLKPVMIALLLCSSSIAYFMDTYDVLINSEMLMNALYTDVREASNLFSVRLIIYVGLLGILPSLILWKMPVAYHPWPKEIARRLAFIVAISISVILIIWSQSSFYGSFFREHKSVRMYANPANYLSASAKIVHSYLKAPSGPIQKIGLDAHIEPDDAERELIIFVVGEAARADHFSLNGYGRLTNPLLSVEDVISFTDVWSCGTSTLASVPCMFSNIKNNDYEEGAADVIENVTDVLERAGVNTLWRDNNSSSKGVANRMQYESFLTPEVNTICDVECRDEGMLVGLDKYIAEHPKGDIVIILHQMGSHGPAYYKRYPKEFERFKPTCQTNELKDCSIEEIANTYDNTILYTDYFLSRVIRFLKAHDDRFETAMFYVSDHGESLGENGIYLHGLPRMIAPDAQRHVPAILWLGKSIREDIDTKALAAKRDRRYSHENIFHTLLGFTEVRSKAYDPTKDILQQQNN